MALGRQLCPICGSPFCGGECQLRQQAMADKQLLEYQRAMLQQMQTAWSPMPPIWGEAPKPKAIKPLPEEEVICATGGLIGWRSWRVPCFGGELLSFNGEAWPVRAPLRAVCRQGPTKCRGAACECGLYAWKKRESLTVNANEYSSIEGEVWLWGKVIDCEKGYRAEFAYPKSFINSADARRLATIYGVKLL